MIDILVVLNKDRQPILGPGDIQDLFADNMEVEGIFHIKRSTLAVRLEYLYEDIDLLEAFSGMVSEPHLPGSDLGELQHKIWSDEFDNLRHADRSFYLNEPEAADLEMFQERYGLDSMQTLSEVIGNNTDLGVDFNEGNPFFALELEVV